MTARKCSRCCKELPLERFKLKTDGGRTQTCIPCAERDAERKRATRATQREAAQAAESNKENHAPAAKQNDTSADTNVNSGRGSGSPARPPVIKTDPGRALPWAEFCTLLREHRQKTCDISTCVALDDVEDEDGEEMTTAGLAAHIVGAIRTNMAYRFNIHKHESRESSEYFSYYCAQREGQQTASQRGKPRANSSKEPAAPNKQRAALCMKRFCCRGGLNISIPTSGAYARVSIYHALAHDAYCNIEVNDDVKKFIEERRHLMPSAIFLELLKHDPTTELEQWQIARYWASICQDQWRRCDDQLESARKVVEEHPDAISIPLDAEVGVSALAFFVKQSVEALNTGVVELAMDSTWKTNKLGFETYGLVAEVNGQAAPLGFLIASLGALAEPGAKTRLLQGVLRALQPLCPNVRFTLSDKDASEINACRAELPESKHQLCYWHAIRYLEQRLAEDKAPAAYDARVPHAEFSFIDPTWQPGVDNGHVVETFTGDDDDPSPAPGPFQPILEEQEFDDLTTCLPPLFVMTVGEARIPVWPAPAKVPAARLPQFCPAEYRPHIVEMFRKHLHMHPEIPVDHSGTRLSAADIRKSAVYQMYRYCYERDLSQVWAYMWNRWYAPSQWPLWARAACAAIPVLKTTMIVESLWKQIKHRDLVAFHQPRLDLLVFVLLTSTVPAVKHHLAGILGERRTARESRLASWQADMKRDWLEYQKPDALRNMQKELRTLLKKGKGVKFAQARADRLAELEADRARPRGDYHTDVQRWTCSCPSYLISRFLLCKHLVRAAAPLLGDRPRTDLRFWLDLRRRRLPPYYVIPGVNDNALLGVDADLDAKYHPQRTLRSSPARDVATDAGTGSAAGLVTSSPSSAASAPAPPELRERALSGPAHSALPVPVDDHPTERVYPTEAQLQVVEMDFQIVREVLQHGAERGLHPRLAQQLDSFLSGMHNFAHDVRAQKRRRTQERTYDATDNTMFLD